MNRTTFSVLALGAAFFSNSAYAANTSLSTSNVVAAPSGSTTVLDFNTTGNAVTYASGKGLTLTRDGGSAIFQSTGNFLSPTPNGGPATQYYVQPDATQGAFYGVGGFVNGVNSYATFMGNGTSFSSISVFIGTIDNYNLVTLLDTAGNMLATYNGEQIFGNSTTFPGSQNLRATFTGTNGQTFGGIKFSSNTGQSSFEFDNLAFTVAAAVPEPATWAMMLVGFGMIGATARYRRRSTKAVLA